jgi:hypothetical protein
LDYYSPVSLIRGKIGSIKRTRAVKRTVAIFSIPAIVDPPRADGRFAANRCETTLGNLT